MSERSQFCYEYPRPAVTVDLVVFAPEGEQLRVLLIRRGQEPFVGHWAFPGGFLDLEEDPETSARRELKEEAGLELPGPLFPVGFFGEPGRDPRGRTISLVFGAVVPPPLPPVHGADDADEAVWLPVDQADKQPLAFDHRAILASALQQLREQVALGKLKAEGLTDALTALS